MFSISSWYPLSPKLKWSGFHVFTHNLDNGALIKSILAFYGFKWRSVFPRHLDDTWNVNLREFWFSSHCLFSNGVASLQNQSEETKGCLRVSSYLSFGLSTLIGFMNCAISWSLYCEWILCVEAGWCWMFTPALCAWFGLMGRGQKAPPQFGQTFFNTLATQSWQNVHS